MLFDAPPRRSRCVARLSPPDSETGGGTVADGLGGHAMSLDPPWAVLAPGDPAWIEKRARIALRLGEEEDEGTKWMRSNSRLSAGVAATMPSSARLEAWGTRRQSLNSCLLSVQ